MLPSPHPPVLQGSPGLCCDPPNMMETLWDVFWRCPLVHTGVCWAPKSHVNQATANLEIPLLTSRPTPLGTTQPRWTRELPGGGLPWRG